MAAETPTPTDALGPRIHLVTGKGGVGKTTLVAAMAVEAARRGHRPLVVELGHRASMEHVFGAEDIGYRPVDVGHGVHAVNVTLEEALLDYVQEQVKVRAVARRIVASRTLWRFFHAAPAVPEVATLHRLARLADERERGAPRWDPILVDLDATGHALMFLGLREVFEGIARGGPIRALLDSMSDLLVDQGRAALHLVTLPAELPVNETVELYHRLAAQGHVHLGLLVVNMVPEPPLGALDPAALEAFARELPAASARQADVALARRAVRRHRAAREQVARLAAEVPLPLVELPERADPAPGGEPLSEMGARVVDALARLDRGAP